ncbi:DUF2280 domain-containing protein [Acinetobacter baumannii]|uniref:DUF2280 domain-containing protein n=1 Tax=Acinetobacter baumannii (strain 1295743) TaxID=1310613 RepID=A0A009IP91_ACIB9|nr:DUF2280 domain-containing protein [Acinetobacter baumannii]ATP86044.1 hypothetical protein A388_00818 [Acinetobacter baumannii]EXB06534.1 hypothetical protein J512_1317 [Acinetobacter baumannii 1295743]MCF4280289.1 DUF2280 domain-containing protein [Acinetobacter baumannii]MCF4287944.1 DUF2280 domain-containing protein [Acinetobacter baumannii]MCF4299062.1 DUF2280 domain-containing protein [Acinetobacter baumannii]
MATLKEPVKIFIVQSLACFDTPQQVVEAVREEFNIELTRQQVASYDPTKATCRALSKKLTALFNKTREDFKKNVYDIPLANKAYRLKELQKIYEKAGKNVQLRQSLIKLAREESKSDQKDSMSEKAQIELEIKKLELEEIKRRVNPPKDKPPEEDYRLDLKPDEELPNEPIL